MKSNHTNLTPVLKTFLCCHGSLMVLRSCSCDKVDGSTVKSSPAMSAQSWAPLTSSLQLHWLLLSEVAIRDNWSADSANPTPQKTLGHNTSIIIDWMVVKKTCMHHSKSKFDSQFRHSLFQKSVCLWIQLQRSHQIKCWRGKQIETIKKYTRLTHCFCKQI